MLYNDGRTFFLNQATISVSVLPPSYGIGLPLMKNFKVGYPLTSYLPATS